MPSEPRTRKPLAALALALAMQKEAVRQNDPNLTIASQDLAEAAVTSHPTNLTMDRLKKT